MGFIKAFSGAISQTFADQWKDFYQPQGGLTSTTAIFRAVPSGTNNGVGQNTKGSENIITNGSKIIVPEGTALITMQDGAITGFIAEAGGYEFKSDDPNSKSMFSNDGILSSTIKESWERFKFGGQPGSQQTAFYVNLKEIAGIRFGTKAPINWNDTFFETRVDAMANGTYSIKITDPMLFVKNLVPVKYLQPDAPTFDFNDLDNETGNQLFEEFVNTLSAGITKLSREAAANGIETYDYVSENRIKFAQTMTSELDLNYQWSSNRGLTVSNVTITIDYTEETKELLKDVQKDDTEVRKAKKMGAAYSNNMAGMMAAASGQAMQAAAANENGAMMGFMGMNMAQNQGTNMMGAVNNMQSSEQAQTTNDIDPYAKLTEMKKLLDAGVITQEDFDAAKSKLLGL